eukprot:Skav209818  [mRNA]  locus=scaffold2424:67246:68412:+ [translate_table: standard]
MLLPVTTMAGSPQLKVGRPIQEIFVELSEPEDLTWFFAGDANGEPAESTILETLRSLGGDDLGVSAPLRWQGKRELGRGVRSFARQRLRQKGITGKERLDFYGFEKSFKKQNKNIEPAQNVQIEAEIPALGRKFVFQPKIFVFAVMVWADVQQQTPAEDEVTAHLLNDTVAPPKLDFSDR